MIEEKPVSCPVCGADLKTDYHDDETYAFCPTAGCIAHLAGEQPLEIWLNRPVESIFIKKIAVMSAKIERYHEAAQELLDELESKSVVAAEE